MSASFSRIVITLAVLLIPQLAHAHLVSARFGEFYSGLLHPLTSLVHLVPWLAMAVFAALQGQAAARRNLLAFPIAVAVGVLLGAALPDVIPVNAVNIASFIILGASVAFALRVPGAIVLGLAVLFGLSHGYANGLADLPARGQLLYVAGVVSTAYLISALVAAFALLLRDRAAWGPVALRVFGSWIVATGVIYAGFQMMDPLGGV